MLYWKKDKIQGIDNLEKRERKVITFPMARFYGNDDRYSHRSWKRLLYMGKRAWKYNWSESSGNAWLGTAGFFAEKYFSRPDVTRRQVKNIVIHYVGKSGNQCKRLPETILTGLADQDAQKEGVSSSSHFVVGLDGEVIQCIPIDEVAYANAPRNDDTLSIEVCHADDTGKFNDASYESVVKLTAWLCKQLKLKKFRCGPSLWY